jgi:hypothetical protein
MRGLETFMVAGLIGLVGVAVWQGRHWFPALTPSGASSMVSPVSAALAKNAKDHKGLSKLAKNSERRSTFRDAHSGNVAALDGGISEVIVPLPGFPTSKTLAVGTTRSELRERYGVPTLDVSSSRDGSLVERYYYVNPNDAHLTVATLHNGKLVSAETVQR